MASQFTVETGLWIYRAPYQHRGRWFCRRRHKLRGKVEAFKLKAENKTEARQEVWVKAEEQRRHEESGKENTEKTDLDLSTAIERWHETLDVRPATLSGYKKAMASCSKMLGSKLTVSSISYAQIEEIFTKGLKARAGRTKILYRSLLNSFFDWCVKHGFTLQNPVRDLTIQKSWQDDWNHASQTRGRALSLEEAQQLLQTAKEHHESMWWFIFISLRTGLRRSNVAGSSHKPCLRWCNVDIKHGTIQIDRSLMKNKLDFRAPMHDELIAKLKTLPVAKPEDPVIPGNVQEVDLPFKKLLRKAGLKSTLRIHDLRHTVGTWIGATCPEAIAAQLLGHSKTTVTRRYTQHQDLEVLREGLNRLEWLTESR